jgi:hypothetical protein
MELEIERPAEVNEPFMHGEARISPIRAELFSLEESTLFQYPSRSDITISQA